MAKLFFILIVGGVLSEGMGPPEPPLLIDSAPSAMTSAGPLDVTH
jgi:hypothetical protein